MAPQQLNTSRIASGRRLLETQSASEHDYHHLPSMSTVYPSPVKAFFDEELELNLDFDVDRDSDFGSDLDLDLDIQPVSEPDSEFDSDLELELDTMRPLSPRTLYAQSFDRPKTSKTRSTRPVRKNLKEMTGCETAEEEFENLPLAVRRKFALPSVPVGQGNARRPAATAAGYRTSEELAGDPLSCLVLPTWTRRSVTVNMKFFRPSPRRETGAANGSLIPLSTTLTLTYSSLQYFSTLERLRFAENSQSNATHNLSIQKNRKSSIALRRGVNISLIQPRRVPSRRQRKTSSKHSVVSNEESWFLTLPDKSKDNDALAGQGHEVFAGQPQEPRRQTTVIPDASDEAFYKAAWQSRKVAQPFDSRPVTPRSSSDDTRPHILEESTSNMAGYMHESFRWVDEEQDLESMLDDYHANLDGVIIPTPYSASRPSFRRNLSPSQALVGRRSISSLQPGSPKPELRNRVRARSRTMSFNKPQHIISSPGATTDSSPTHYQHPEARMKLRVYLASPQKFDEAIEFGFPSIDDLTEGAEKVTEDAEAVKKPRPCPSKDVERVKNSFASDRGLSFLNDDMVSLSEDDISMADTESPLTPSFGHQNRPLATSGSKAGKSSFDSHLGIGKPISLKQPDSHPNSMAGSREMTLRMTLTRSDLRADETAIYGWQRCKSSVSDEPSSSLDEKCEMRGPLGGADGWAPLDKEACAIKRFWNKVKSAQKKTT
ncbi:hypothetical protein JHW43_007205 [Diplocarpon mali]|nr:hypothetical protein JHW43_007205 [Diplocarpon mali]